MTTRGNRQGRSHWLMKVPHLRYLQAWASSWFLGIFLVFLAPSIGKYRRLGYQYLSYLAQLGLKYFSSLVLSFSIVNRVLQ